MPAGEHAVRLVVWFPPEIAVALRRRAVSARQPVSVFLREALLSGGFPRPVPAIHREAWTALSTALANLNQLAAHANRAALGNRPVDFQGLPASLAEMRRVVGQIRAQLIDDEVPK